MTITLLEIELHYFKGFLLEINLCRRKRKYPNTGIRCTDTKLISENSDNCNNTNRPKM